MRRPSIGTSVIDTTRRELGAGVLRGWFVRADLGLYAHVRFADGLRIVRWANCVTIAKAGVR